jgi:hypothetical protein
MRVVIPGGSGQLGQLLARGMQAAGHDVVILGRDPARSGRAGRFVPWDAGAAHRRGADPGAWARELDGADVVINLAGRSVDCRYTRRNRAAILGSRVDSTLAIGTAMAMAARPPRLWLQASTATIYAHSHERANDEAGGVIGGEEPGLPATWRFSIEVAKAWEAAAAARPLPHTRLVLLRTAMVMSPDKGSVFDVLSRLCRSGLGGTPGDGRQFVSWIHGQDFRRAIEFLIERDDLAGAVNLAAPTPLPYAEFARALRVAWGIPVGLPAPRWLLEIGTFLLRTESELVLKSRRVVPGRLLAAGFRFLHPEWPAAAGDLVQAMRGAARA